MTTIVSDDAQNDYDSESDDAQNNRGNHEDYSFFENVMFESSKFTVRYIIVLSSAFALRFHLSDEAHLEMMNFLKLCAGSNFSDLNLSKHMMSKCFSLNYEQINYHYYCSTCLQAEIHSVDATNAVKKLSVLCNKCKEKNDITALSPNYFISVSLAHQVKELLSNKILVNDILNNVSSRNKLPADRTNESVIRDVYDSDIHQKIMRSNNDNENEYTLTFSFNTDGAPLTKSGKRGFWPLQLTLNDLSPKFRFRFVILGGVMIVKKEPTSNLLNLYLSKTLVQQMRKLNNKRIILRTRGRKIVLKFCILSCIVDSVCRPLTQNRLQFNGYHGCSWCYQRGLYLLLVHGIRYINEQNSIHRTNASHIKDVKIAEGGSTENGIKGPSCLMELPNFDMVWSFPFEYMHGLLLGVTHQLWKEWKDGDSPYKIKKTEINTIEKRFLTITPTHEIHRLPRSGIIQGTAKPKGSELKSWLLYYSLPCLNGILPDCALNHFALLVKSAYTLLKYEVTEEELQDCEKDLLEFVVMYECLYGEKSMTFNVHSLLHVAESVRKTGPLCVNSAFPFESNIYNLKTYVNGPKGMDRQMTRKHLQSLTFKAGNTNKFGSPEEVNNYCLNLFSHKRLSTYYKDGPKDITYFGRSILVKINELGECLTYTKCIYKGTLYHSIKYCRAKKN